MNILLLCVELPFPAIGGGLTRTYQVIKALSEQHEVTVVGFTFDKPIEPSGLAIEIVGVKWEMPELYTELYNEAGDETLTQRAMTRLAFEVPEPWYVSYFKSDAMCEQIKSIVKDKQFDLIVIEDSDMAQYLSVLPVHVPKVLDMHNVYSLMAKRAFEDAEADQVHEKEFEYKRTIAHESSVSSQCDLCLTCSEKEAEAVKDLLGIEHVTVVPNGVDTKHFKPSFKQPLPNTLLFTGTMSYEPNVEGICWFVKRVLPIITKQIPEVLVHVVGTNPVERVLKLASGQVIVHGRVPDMAPFFDAASVYMAPILSGGGTRLKILEAAASGKAIVTTSLGAEGIDLVAGEEILIADSAEEFGNVIVQILNDSQLRQRLEHNVRRSIYKYDWETIKLKINSLINNLAPASNKVSNFSASF